MDHFKSIIGASPALQELIRSARLAAGADVTILLQGETGTGKEILANAIQKHSRRAQKPFVVINCAAIPEDIAESELFGHKKGAYTGADSDKIGLFRTADGGTLFLDEINSLPLSTQPKLLRFLESGECQAVGETKPYRANVRLIAASNTDLNRQAELGKFRRDLFFRLSVVPLHLPSLKERPEDIEPLARHFLTVYAQQHNLKPCVFSAAALKYLYHYAWPGNVRELRNLCERLSILLAGKIIEPDNLPLEFNVRPLPAPRTSRFALPSAGIVLDNMEANLINQALNRTHGNLSQAARLLGISRYALIYRLRKHGLHYH
ncbi:MAG: sigma-54 dependent transcriptional regulator [Methylomonas sp.]|jgi:DNA-binding NtrC family response regulator